MGDPRLVIHRRQPGNLAAVVFLHGFLGDAAKTWGDFPRYLAEEPALRGWDVLSVGYATNLFAYLPFWSSDPNLTLLAGQLSTVVGHSLEGYRQLALVAHSMGGLIAQRSLLDSPEVERRTGFLFLFGTPSNGLGKARRLGRIKRQIADMVRDGPFIQTLRSEWRVRFDDRSARPFHLTVVGGDRDQFVPPEAWLTPFDPTDCEVSHGDHVQIVKPCSAEHLSVQIVVKNLVRDAAPGGPWSAARVALEGGDFRATIATLEPNVADLDDAALVDLALALEAIGQAQKAFDYLERYATSTDAHGTLAGRLKRRWLHHRKRIDGTRALEVYRDAYGRAVAASDHPQAFYLGINVAFLEAVFARDQPAARATAARVLDHCRQSPSDYWNLATSAEARLHLGAVETALGDYAAALRTDPEPRQIQSTYQQAVQLAEHLGLPPGECEALERCFRGAFS